MLLTFALTSAVLAVHDEQFELDGNIANDGALAVDWEDIFDVSGTDVPTPADPLPAGIETADFVRDFVPGASGPDRTTFTTGSKDTLNISDGWQCARSNNVNDKTDVVNAYAAVDTSSGDTILYFALERFSNEGAGNVSFWFLQDENVDCITPASGPSTTPFTGDHVDGDLLVVSEFTVGGTVSTIQVYEWVGGADGFLNPTPVTSGVDCSTAPPGDNICASVNTEVLEGDASPPGPDIPWLTETKQPGNTPSNNLNVSEFFEGGLNLTQAGLEGCFGTFLADTRSSPSLTATIFDYALGHLDLCAISVVKDGDELSKVGDPVDYTITITNDGAIKLYKDDITDTLLGNITVDGVDQANPFVTSRDCGPSLAPHESCTITLTRTVEETDPDPLVNTVTLTCSPDGFPNVLEETASHSVNLFQPAIAVDKTGDELSKAGDDVDYTFTLSNNSSADTPALTCTAEDDVLGEIFSGVLPPGDTVVNATRTVLETDPDPLVNTVTLTCSPDGFPNVLEETDSHSVNLFQPAIAVDKTGDELSKVGDDVNYTFTLSNNSSADTPALNCTAVDSLFGEIFSGVLPSGDTVVNATRTVLETDPDPLVNTVTLTCSPDGFPNVLTATDDHSVNLFQPDVMIEKTGDALGKVGDPVDYTITVTNTSSADSPNLTCTITDPLLGLNKVVNLTPGESDITNVQYIVQPGDPDPLVNTSSVTCGVDGFPNVLGPLTASHTVNLF